MDSLRIRPIPKPKCCKVHVTQVASGDTLPQQRFPQLPAVRRQITLTSRRNSQYDNSVLSKFILRCKVNILNKWLQGCGIDKAEGPKGEKAAGAAQGVRSRAVEYDIKHKMGWNTYNINTPSIHSRNARGEAQALCYRTKEMRCILAGAGFGGVQDKCAALVARGRERDRDGSGGHCGHGGRVVIVIVGVEGRCG